MTYNYAHTFYFDRRLDSIHGLLTLQYVDKREPGKAIKVFDRLPCNSGQRGFTNSDWVTSKSPTPIGRHILKTKVGKLVSAEPYNTPFYTISSQPGGTRIVGPGNSYRDLIGLHLDNNLPGSAGCPALENKTEVQRCMAYALFGYLDELAKYEKYVGFVVL